MVGTGDEDQLRKLLADGTIFCRMSDYNVLLQGTTHSKPRTPQNSVWRSMIQDKMDNVKPFMEMLMKRGLHQQKLQTPGNFIGPYYKESVSNSCYDVSFREGHDLMLKWAIANRNEAATQMLVEMAPPRGRLHNLYVGALYLGYLCDYGKFQQLSTSVDCAKASQNIRAICSQIWLNANQPQQGEKPPKQNLTLPEPYYSAKFRDQPADVLKEFLNYDRRQISNFEFLEAL
ncbi:hypothetical protein IWQ62_006038 [Dispira parvispora]|uniref:Uncharacterized protein n=1 Tax=Dispira parvispora TaxID=1520584 RepID=A0A9W8AHH9_9FUNG|nr:hypothetical protein IWQ62_006038 [Dispira parvispora]